MMPVASAGQIGLDLLLWSPQGETTAVRSLITSNWPIGAMPFNNVM